jgi:hypothetical protein
MVCKRLRDGREKVRLNEVGRKERMEGDVEVAESSMRFRRAMMKSMRASWKRSTISARYDSDIT